MFERLNVIDRDSFIDFYYEKSKITLHTEYKSFLSSSHPETVHEINPKIGIV